MADRANDVDLSDDDATALQTGVLAKMVRDAGILIRPDDRGATMLTISPPLVADRAVIDDLVERVDQVLVQTTKWLGGDR